MLLSSATDLLLKNKFTTSFNVDDHVETEIQPQIICVLLLLDLRSNITNLLDK